MIDPAVARGIKLLILDVDGVLTDNAVHVGLVDGRRVELKSFDIQDGLGIVLLRETGIAVVWMSGRESEATTLRATELKIEEVLQLRGAAKLPATLELMQRRSLRWEDIAFVGDDLADLPVMRRAALPIAVANAVDEIKDSAAFVTQRAGGRGAVREAIETLLKARGEWEQCVQGYLRDRGDDAA